MGGRRLAVLMLASLDCGLSFLRTDHSQQQVVQDEFLVPMQFTGAEPTQMIRNQKPSSGFFQISAFSTFWFFLEIPNIHSHSVPQDP